MSTVIVPCRKMSRPSRVGRVLLRATDMTLVQRLVAHPNMDAPCVTATLTGSLSDIGREEATVRE